MKISRVLLQTQAMECRNGDTAVATRNQPTCDPSLRHKGRDKIGICICMESSEFGDVQRQTNKEEM